MVCPEVCPQVLEVCQVQVHPPVQDPDPLSKRSTNVLFWITNPTNNRKSADFFFKTGNAGWFIHFWSSISPPCGEQTIMSKLLLKTKSFSNFLFLSDLNKTFKYNTIFSGVNHSSIYLFISAVWSVRWRVGKWKNVGYFRLAGHIHKYSLEGLRIFFSGVIIGLFIYFRAVWLVRGRRIIWKWKKFQYSQ